MSLNVAKELAALERMTVRELRERYAAAFGEPTRTGNKAWLVKRIIWRLQSLEDGDISERALRRAAELARDADVRLSPPRTKPREAPAADRTTTAVMAFAADGRLPPPGTIITRPYKGQTLRVHVLEKGFEFDGDSYKSLSAVAKAITGQHCNGYHFFRLRTEKPR